MKKGLIFDIKRFAVHDGDGIRTTVFFGGCPLRCVWCHNPEGIAPRPTLALYQHKCIGCGACVSACASGAHYIGNVGHSLDRKLCSASGACASVCLEDALKLYGRYVTVEDILPELISDRAFFEQSGGGVTLSGGECLMQADFAASLLSRLKNEGINTAVDTSGYVKREAIEAVLPYTDAFLYDLKAYDSEVHRRCTGHGNGIILENLRYLDTLGTRIEIRVPYVPDYNDTEMSAIADFIRELRTAPAVRVLAYHNYAGSKYTALGLENTLPKRIPTDEEMAEAREIFKKKGIPVIN